jgi:hypothetical protein
MNLSAMQIRLNYRRRDTTENFVTYDEAKAYFNEALRRIKAEANWEFDRVSTSISYVDGSSVYQLSSVAPHSKQPIGLFYTDAYDFKIVTPEEFRALSAHSGLNLYAFDNSMMYIDTTFGTGTLRYDYFTDYVGVSTTGALISALSSALDEPLIPEMWQDMIIDYAAARCYQKEKLDDDYKIAMNDFLRNLRKMNADYSSEKAKPAKRMRMGSQFGYGHSTEATKNNVLGY